MYFPGPNPVTQTEQRSAQCQVENSCLAPVPAAVSVCQHAEAAEVFSYHWFNMKYTYISAYTVSR